MISTNHPSINITTNDPISSLSSSIISNTTPHSENPITTTTTRKSIRPLPFQITIAQRSSIMSSKKPLRVYSSASRKDKVLKVVVTNEAREMDMALFEAMEGESNIRALGSSSTLVGSSSLMLKEEEKIKTIAEVTKTARLVLNNNGRVMLGRLVSDDDEDSEKPSKGTKKSGKKKKKKTKARRARAKRAESLIEDEEGTSFGFHEVDVGGTFALNRENEDRITPDTTLVSVDKSTTSSYGKHGGVDSDNGSDHEDSEGGSLSEAESAAEEIQQAEEGDGPPSDDAASDGDPSASEGNIELSSKSSSPSAPSPTPEPESDVSESSDEAISPFATKNVFARLALESSMMTSKSPTGGRIKGMKDGKQLWSTTASVGSERGKVEDWNVDALRSGLEVEVVGSWYGKGEDGQQSPSKPYTPKPGDETYVGSQPPASTNNPEWSGDDQWFNASGNNHLKSQSFQQDPRRGGVWHQQPYRGSVSRGGRGNYRGGPPNLIGFDRPLSLAPRSPFQGSFNGDSPHPPYHNSRNASGFQGPGGNEQFETPRRPLGPAALRRKQEVDNAEIAKNPIDGTPMYVLAEVKERPNYDATLYIAGIWLCPDLTESETRFQLLRHLQRFVADPNAIEKIRVTRAPTVPEYVAFVSFLTSQDAEIVLNNPEATKFQPVSQNGSTAIADQPLRVEKTAGQRSLWIHIVGKRKGSPDFTANDTEVLPHSFHAAPKTIVFERFLDRAGYHNDGILKTRLRPQLCLEESDVQESRAQHERHRRSSHFLGNPVWESAGKTTVSADGLNEAEIIKQCSEVFGGVDFVKPWHNKAQGGYLVQFWDRESAIRCCNQLRLLDGIAVWWASEKEPEVLHPSRYTPAFGNRVVDPTAPHGAGSYALKVANGASNAFSKPTAKTLPKEEFPALPGQEKKFKPSIASETLKVLAEVTTETSEQQSGSRADAVAQSIEGRISKIVVTLEDQHLPERAEEDKSDTNESPAEPPTQVQSPTLVFGDMGSTFSADAVPSHPRRQPKRGSKRNRLDLTAVTQGLGIVTNAVLHPLGDSGAHYHEQEDSPAGAPSSAELQRADFANQVEERLTMVLTGLDANVETLESVRERCRVYGRITNLEFPSQQNRDEAMCLVAFSSYVGTKLAIAAENGRVVNGRVQRATSRWNFLRGGDEPMTTPSPPITRSQVVLPGNSKTRSITFGSHVVVEIPQAPVVAVTQQNTSASLITSPTPAVTPVDLSGVSSSTAVSAMPPQARSLHKQVSFAQSPSRRRALSDPGSPGLKKIPSIDPLPSATMGDLASPELPPVLEKVTTPQSQHVVPRIIPASVEEVQQASEQIPSPEIANIAPPGGIPGFMPYYWPMPMPYPMPYGPGGQFPTMPTGASPNLLPPFFGATPTQQNNPHPPSPPAPPMPALTSAAPKIPGNRPSLSNLRSSSATPVVDNQSLPNVIKSKSSLQPLSYLQGPHGLVAVYDSDELTRYRKENKIPEVKQGFVEDKSLQQVTLLPLSSGGHSPERVERTLPSFDVTFGAQPSVMYNGPQPAVYPSVQSTLSDSQASETNANPFGTPVVGSSYLPYNVGGELPSFYGAFEHPQVEYGSAYQGNEQPPLDFSMMSPVPSFANPSLHSIMRPGSHAAAYGLGPRGGGHPMPVEEYQQAPASVHFKNNKGGFSSATRPRGNSTHGHPLTRQGSNRTFRSHSVASGGCESISQAAYSSNVAPLHSPDGEPAMDGYKGYHHPHQPAVHQNDAQKKHQRDEAVLQSGGRFAYGNRTVSAALRE